MYIVHVWNKLRPNYGTNAFVERNGTDQIEFDDLGDAVTFRFNDDTPGVCRFVIRDQNGDEIPGHVIFAKMMKSLFG